MNAQSSRTLISLIPFILVPSLSAATSIALTPVADAFVTSANPTGNFGGGGAVGISAPGLPKGELQFLMMFNFSTAKIQLDSTYGVGGWVVDTLVLQLAAANPGNSVFNASAAGSIAMRWFDDDTWVEGAGKPTGPDVPGVNFNSLPGLLAAGAGAQSVGTYPFGGGASGSNAISLTSSAGLTADILAGSTASIDFYAGDSNVSGVFNSRNFSDSANWPALTLTASAIPEPSAGLFAILAMVAPVIRRRR